MLEKDKDSSKKSRTELIINVSIGAFLAVALIVFGSVAFSGTFFFHDSSPVKGVSSSDVISTSSLDFKALSLCNNLKFEVDRKGFGYYVQIYDGAEMFQTFSDIQDSTGASNIDFVLPASYKSFKALPDNSSLESVKCLLPMQLCYPVSINSTGRICQQITFEGDFNYTYWEDWYDKQFISFKGR